VPPDRRRMERLQTLLPDIRALVAPRRGTLALGIVLIGVTRVTTLAAPAAMKLLIDDVVGDRRVDLLLPIVLVVTVATLLQAGISYALTHVFSRSAQRLTNELRGKLHAHVMRLPLLYHDTHKSGSLASRILNDLAGVQNLVGLGLLGFAGTLMTALFALAVMAHFSPRLALLSLVCVTTAAVIAGARTRSLRELSWERSELDSELYGRLMEALGGVRVIKAYRAEEREQAIFAEGNERILENSMKSVRLSSRLSLATTVLWGLVNAVVMYAGVRAILAGTLTLGGFFTVTVLLNYLAAPALQIVGIGSMIMTSLGGLERTRQILRERPEDEDPRRQVQTGALRGEVLFDHVDFAYAPGKSVLHDVSFRAEPGTVTALVGPSGAGKSTITGLIGSFYVPTAGEIRVDGMELGTVCLAPYRRQLGVVLQETFLFEGSILDNIAFARPGATRDEILAAARSARVDEFAEAIDGDYDALIGERGVRLSGGQRQRISIARALLADPRIVILDEATSSLDTKSEALIQEALARLLVGRTTFVIAHRLSTVRRADQILVVDGGRIVERGTHASLLAEGGLYAEMHRRQHDTDASLFLAPGEDAAPPVPPSRHAEQPSEADAGSIEL
jgi:ABC-type multidrug transport system fused ATPase/permease subunit